MKKFQLADGERVIAASAEPGRKHSVPLVHVVVHTAGGELRSEYIFEDEMPRAMFTLFDSYEAVSRSMLKAVNAYALANKIEIEARNTETK